MTEGAVTHFCVPHLDADPRDLTDRQLSEIRDYLNSNLFAFAWVIFGFRDLYPPLHMPLCDLVARWGDPGYRRIMIQVPRGTFKCLAAGSLVHTPSGPVPVEDLSLGDPVIGLWGVTNRVVATNRTVAPAIRVETRSGLSVTVTPHHPFLTVRGWVQARDLKPGDGIASPRRIPIAPRAAPFPYTAGVLTGDGCWSNYTLFATEPEILQAVAAEGVPLRPRKAKHTFGIPKAVWDATGVRGRSPEKRIPPQYEGNADFIAGLFDADGTVGENGVPTFTTASYQLAKDLQRNLRYFGITSTVTTWTARNQYPGFVGRYYGVRVTGVTSRRNFARHIPLRLKRKLDRIVTEVSIRGGTRYEGVPPAWRDLLRKQKKGGKDYRGDLRLLRDAGIRCDNHYWTDRRKFLEAVRHLGLRHIEWIGNDWIAWEQVKSVDPVDEADIVEMEVSGDRTYLAECLVHHNTSLCTIANSLWQICRDPDSPVAIFNERLDNSASWVRAIREVIQSSRVFQEVYRDLLPPGIHPEDRRSLPRWWKWTDTELLLQRGRMGIPEASITAMGIGAASAGRHWPKIIKDDLISEDAVRSPAIMEAAKEWFSKSFYLEKPAMRGQDLVVCTRWSYGDLYSWIEERYDYVLYRRSAIENGRSIWPEMFPLDYLRAYQERDPYEFSAQMMNQPMAGRETQFSRDWLRWFTIEGDEVVIEGELPDRTPLDPGLPPTRRVRLSQLSKALLVDPAPSEGTPERRREPGARSAIVVCGMDAWGRRYLLDAWADRVDPYQLIHRILGLAERWGASVVGIEEVVFSMIYRHWIQRELRSRGTWLSLRPLKPGRRDKETRITAQIPACREGLWYVNRRGTEEWLEEYLTFPYGRTRDLVDAWAYAEDLLRPPESPAWQETRRRDGLWPFGTRNPVTAY